MRIIPAPFAAALIICAFPPTLSAQVPQLVNYQGRIAVGAVNFDGAGQFKFALVNATGTTAYWRNAPDTSPADGVPDAAVSITVTKGLYSVLLGDATLPNMAAVPNSVFNNADVHLRVWFNDGANGFQLLTPDQRIAAVGYALMAGNVPDGAITSAKIANGAVGTTQLAAGAVQAGNLAAGAVTTASIATGAVGSAQLAGGAAVANLAASGLSGVPGSGLILSATEQNPTLINNGYVKLGTVRTGDTWQERISAAPSGRYLPAVVWTGAEMIVWGGKGTGFNELTDGARYDPAANAWTALPVNGAPAGRDGHTGVWTGTDMIVWGGWNGSTAEGSGGRWNLATNTWTALPAGGGTRSSHTAVWTGTEMIVWGGGNGSALRTGARYDPAANTWTPVNLTGAPAGRYFHTAVWTGTEMIVWGGWNGAASLNTGGRYNPANNSWTAVSTASAPSARTRRRSGARAR